MSAIKTLCTEVELLVQFPEVGLAISDSAAPVPGYLIGEINAITYIDYGSNCKPLVNFLISRLLPDTPLVSIKILKLLLHLVKNGHTEIVEEVKFHEVSLKGALGFHGPPDDLHGKTFYESIRKIAKEILEFVFSENKEIRSNTPPTGIPELTGYGSSANTTGLPGFGFSVKTQKSVSEKISDGVTSFVEKLLPAGEREIQETQASHLGETLPQYKPLIINREFSEGEKSMVTLESHRNQQSSAVIRTKQKTRVYKPGKPGGGWDDSEDEEDVTRDIEREENSKCSSRSFDCLEISKMEIKESTIDWVDEHKVVDEFTVSEPLHMLEYSCISSLCKKCSSLNCDKILTFLLEKLEVKEELVQLRALIFIEYLIFHDIVSLDSLIKILTSPLSNLIEKAEDVPRTVTLKAKKVCLIIQNLNKSSPQHLSSQPAKTAIQCNS